MNLFLYMHLLTVACNREIQHLFLNWLFVVKKRKKKKTLGSGRVRALNLTVPLGSGRVGSGRVRRSRVRAGFGLQFKVRVDL